MLSKCIHIAGVGFVKRPEKCIAGQEEAEIVWNKRQWDGKQRQKRQAERNHAEAHID